MRQPKQSQPSNRTWSFGWGKKSPPPQATQPTSDPVKNFRPTVVYLTQEAKKEARRTMIELLKESKHTKKPYEGDYFMRAHALQKSGLTPQTLAQMLQNKDPFLINYNFNT